MRKIIYKIEDSTSTKQIEFITDRNREPLTMELISNETTEETEAISREVELG
jgi:hypothetical protein